jgi:hypothetical protein
MFAQIECPLAGMDDEHFGGLVIVLRVDAVRRLASTADVEAVRFRNVNELVRVLGYPGPMIVKFSLASEPGFRVSMNALRQGLRSA